MMKQLMLGAAVSALMISAVSAQAPSAPPSSTPAPSAQTAPSPMSNDNAMVMSQKPDQFMASSFKGTDVLGADDKKIGDVSDILFNKDGKIDAYVVSVGGFLGMGAKEVALAPSAFQLVPGDKSKGEADKLKTSMTQDQLKQAQNFARYEPPKPTTTGAGSSGAMTGAGPGGRPSTNTPPTGR